MSNASPPADGPRRGRPTALFSSSRPGPESESGSGRCCSRGSVVAPARRLRRRRGHAEGGRARHARLLRRLEARPCRVRAGDRADAAGSSRPATPASRSTERSSPPATRRATSSSASTTTCCRARSTTICSRRTSRPSSPQVPAEYDLDDEHRVTPVDHGEVCLNVDRGWFASRDLDAAARLRRPARPALPRPARRREPGHVHARARLPARHDRAVRRGGLARLVAPPARERGARRRRLGGGVHRALQRCRREQGRPADRRLVRLEPTGRGDLRRPRARRGADRGRRVDLLPAGGARGCPARRPQSRGRAGADRLHALAGVPADVPLSMFVFPVREGVALPPEFERFAVVPARPLELSPARIGRNRDRWIREWTDDRAALTILRATAVVVPAVFLALFFAYPLAGRSSSAGSARAACRPTCSPRRPTLGCCGSPSGRRPSRRC